MLLTMRGGALAETGDENEAAKTFEQAVARYPGLTPVLLEQLSHEHFKDGFERYLADRVEQARQDRKDFEGWLSSSTTVEQAVKDGLPLVMVGDPVYYEPLGVAFDKQGPDPTDMVAKVDTILADMRADGTLKKMSEKWFGLDLTVEP